MDISEYYNKKLIDIHKEILKVDYKKNQLNATNDFLEQYLLSNFMTSIISLLQINNALQKYKINNDMFYFSSNGFEMFICRYLYKAKYVDVVEFNYGEFNVEYILVDHVFYKFADSDFSIVDLDIKEELMKQVSIFVDILIERKEK